MIYGANGYTGRLTANEAVRRGMRPVLAGRNAPAIESLAQELGMDCAVISLDDGAALRQALAPMSVVLHCAGPFSATAEPMVEACLDTGTHYLDITGEISVFEALHALDARARQADVVLCPGAGFDVVPTDCLAARLVEALPAATRLVLAFEAGGGPSPGTAKTSIEGLGRGGCVRKNGRLKRVPLAWKTREIPFASGTRHAMTIPWGDVFTAWVSTGIGDIEVYLSVSPATSRRLQRIRWLRPFLALDPVQRWMKRRIERTVRGPDADTRQTSQTQLWGEAASADGRLVSGQMTTPNGYELTVTASLALVDRLLSGQGPEGGYYTPSLLMGADYAATLPDVTMRIDPVREA